MFRQAFKMSFKVTLHLLIVCLVPRLSGSMNNTYVKMAFILPEDNNRLFSIARVRSAVDVALEKTKILSLSTYINFTATYMDSNCNAIKGAMAAYDSFMGHGIHVFFGPVCSYSLAPVARYAPVWNIPVVTAGAMSHEFQNKIPPGGEYETLTRVGVTYNTLSFRLLEILRQNKWKHVKFILNPKGQEKIVPHCCYRICDSIINHMKREKYRNSYHTWDIETEKPDYILKEIVNTQHAG